MCTHFLYHTHPLPPFAANSPLPLVPTHELPPLGRTCSPALFLCWVFSRQSLENYLPGLASNRNPTRTFRSVLQCFAVFWTQTGRCISSAYVQLNLPWWLIDWVCVYINKRTIYWFCFVLLLLYKKNVSHFWANMCSEFLYLKFWNYLTLTSTS
jgi:hypothetical protein